MLISRNFFAASAKKKDANMIVRDGTDILKQLYKSKDDQIKVRALVGLCKLASSSGHDASLRYILHSVEITEFYHFTHFLDLLLTDLVVN